MAKVWKKLQRADGDFTGTIDGTNASTIKTGASAGSAAKTITDAAFDGDTKLKTANAQAGMINSNTTATDVGLGSVENKSSATIRGEITVANITTDAGLGKGDIGLGAVENKSAATIMAGDLTGSVDGTAVATVKSGAAAGATANQDSTSTILGGTLTGAVSTSATVGGTAFSTVKSGAASGATANQDSTSTILGGTFTGDIGGTSASDIKSGAAAGATANQDSTSTILGGTLTGAISTSATLDGTAMSTVKSGAASGATANQDSTASIRSGTTATHVGLGSVVNQAITVASGKIKFDGAAQTIDADKVGGKTVAEAESSASSAAQTAIIGGAPGALNTLDELAAALGDDASFATTTTNALATKGKAPMALTAEDVDGDSTFTNDPANEVVGQIGVVGGEQYVVVDV